MALEIFAQVDDEGEVGTTRCNDYLFVGSAGDFRTLAKWVMDGFEAGSRKPTMKALSERISEAAPVAHYIRLKAKESQLLLEALERKKASPSKSPAATKLLRKLEGCLFVFG